jgi:hypothetical protein
LSFLERTLDQKNHATIKQKVHPMINDDDEHSSLSAGPDSAFLDHYERLVAQGEADPLFEWWDNLTDEQKQEKWREVVRKDAAFQAASKVRGPDDSSYDDEIDRIAELLLPLVEGTPEEIALYDFATEVLESAVVNGTSVEEETAKEIEHIKTLLLEHEMGLAGVSTSAWDKPH